MRISDTGKRLKFLMEARGLKQVDILNLAAPHCKKRGIRMNRSDLSQYVSGKVEPSQEKLAVLSLALGVSEPWLMGYDVSDSSASLPHPDLLSIDLRKIPLLGPVAAGEPIMADPEYDEFVVVVGDGCKADAALRVEGDSMLPRYLDRDIVFIRIQDDVEDGEVAAVQIDDNVTLKHVYHIPGGVQLISDNPAYKPMLYTAENADCIRIIGKAIGFQRWER